MRSPSTLVVVDREYVLEGGDGIPRLSVPLSEPRFLAPNILSDRLEETITISAESPLLDAQRLALGTTIKQMELTGLPVFDLWSSVGWAPSVQSAAFQGTSSVTTLPTGLAGNADIDTDHGGRQQCSE